MVEFLIDIETNLAHDTIHLVCVKDLSTGVVSTWRDAAGFNAQVSGADRIIAHNGIKFDFHLLTKLWGMSVNRYKWFDTLCLSRLLNPSRLGGHSLDALGRELGIEKINYKAEWEKASERVEAYQGECYDKPVMELLEPYCVQDIEVMDTVYRALLKKFESAGFAPESLALEFDVAYIIAEQERNGFTLDTVAATLLLANVTSELDTIAEAMQRRWPPTPFKRFGKHGAPLKDGLLVFNPASRVQVGQKLIEMGWEPTVFTETGKPKLDEAEFAKVDIPEAREIMQYFKLQKLQGFVRSWFEFLTPQGRVHGAINTNGAVTGRMSHFKPNMGQVPKKGALGKKCRGCWIPSAGRVMVGADASGLELRMLAHYMKDEKYIKAVCEGTEAEGTDVHTLNKIAAGLPSRDAAKTFIYAWLYGAGSEKIGKIAGGGAAKGAKLIKTFLAATPAVKDLKERVERLARSGTLTGLDGRKLEVRSMHAALNTLLQGAGAAVMKKALVLFYEACNVQGLKIWLLANVHDEFQWECAEEDAERTGALAVDSIRLAGEIYNVRCPLTGAYKVGLSWAETH